jgi:hypothetical protein
MSTGIGQAGASTTPTQSQRWRNWDLRAPTMQCAVSFKASNRCPHFTGGNRKKGGPTYHIDYVFLPSQSLGRVRELTVGTFEDWCKRRA